VLSSHLPPMHGAVDRAVATLRSTPSADPVPPMTQNELEVLLTSFEPQKETADVR
jgi:hypothetical protein